MSQEILDSSVPVPASALAQRLRELRAQWPGAVVTQRQLADALGASIPLISSWESTITAPSEDWLRLYARFFATHRSVDVPSLVALSLSHPMVGSLDWRVQRPASSDNVRMSALGDGACRSPAGARDPVLKPLPMIGPDHAARRSWITKGGRT